MIPQFKRTPTSVETFNENENHELNATRESLKDAEKKITLKDFEISVLRKQVDELTDMLKRKPRYVFVEKMHSPPYGN